MNKSKYAYGIDFGTTNSTITAITSNREPIRLEIDKSAENPAVMRSVIYVNHKHELLFGKEAIDKYIKDIAEGKIARRKKIFTGRYIKITSPGDAGGVRKDEIVPEIIEIEEGEGGRLLQSLKSILSSQYLSTFQIFGKEFTVDEIIASFLREMKARADRILKTEVSDVVIGRPVKFVGSSDSTAVGRLEKAAKQAGFKNIVFEYEPVGAAYDYGINEDKSQTALMFDFGGGTLDLTIMKFPNKKAVINTGIPLGGDFLNSQIFSTRLARYFGKEATYTDKNLEVPQSIYENLRNWYTISLLKTESFSETLERLKFNHSQPKALEALKSLVYDNLGFSLYEEIDRVKKSLSNIEHEIVNINKGEIKISDPITRIEFENIISPNITDIKTLIDDTLEQAGISSEEIDVVATTGGSSLMPVVENLLIEKFGKEKMKNTDAFTSVSTGLALRAHEEYFPQI